MNVRFNCECSTTLEVEAAHAGRTVRCPACEQLIVVPSVRRGHPPSEADSQLPATFASHDGASRSAARSPAQRPTSSSLSAAHLLAALLTGWCLAIVLTFLGGVLAGLHSAIVLFLAVVATAIFAVLAVNLLVAKNQAMAKGEAYAWLGQVHIVAWNPRDGIILLRDKQVIHVDDNPEDGGGIHILFPFRGEEVACFVPLEDQTSVFTDNKVKTSEFIPVTVRVRCTWRIVDAQTFYLRVSRDVHLLNDQGRHAVLAGEAIATDLNGSRQSPQRAAEELMRLNTEECTRSVCSSLQTGLLVAEKITALLPPSIRSRLDPSALTPAAMQGSKPGTHDIAERLRAVLLSRMHDYGIDVLEVALLDIDLPESIQNGAIRAAKKAYAPMAASYDAFAGQIGHHTEADGRGRLLSEEAAVIGKEAVGQREVVGAVRPHAFTGMPPSVIAVLNDHFAQQAAQGGTN